jgi:DNA repair protein RecO
MATYITDDGICLRVTDFSETSQIVGMFTRAHGLVPLIAKGSKRASKRNVMSGPLDLLTGGEVVFVPAREGGAGVQLGTLAAWELADQRQELRRNLAGLNAAMVCAEVTTHLLQPLDPHSELFDELQAAMELLGAAREARASARVLIAYVKAALIAAGYWPQLETCLACGKMVRDVPMRFGVRLGGVLCGGGGEKSGCHVDSSVGGLTMVVPGRVVVALERLLPPTQLRGKSPDRAAEPGALKMALEMLLAQVEAVADKAVRTRAVVNGIAG